MSNTNSYSASESLDCRRADVATGLLSKTLQEFLMPQFDPKLVQLMRIALDDVMARVPSEHASPAIKVYLADCILRAAAQGHTSYTELVAAAANQLQTAISLFQ